MAEKKQSLAELVRDVVDEGATTVEDIHKAIAALPLRVLESLGPLEESAQEIKRIQDESIGAVYDVIRQINHRVSELATDLLKSSRKT